MKFQVRFLRTSISLFIILFSFTACPRRPEVDTYFLVRAHQTAEHAEIRALDSENDARRVRLIREQALQGIAEIRSKLSQCEGHISDAEQKLHKLGARFPVVEQK